MPDTEDCAPTWAGMYERQCRISEAYFRAAGVPPDARVKHALLALLAECGELLQATECDWKWWKRCDENREDATGELQDVFLMAFLVAACLEIPEPALRSGMNKRLEKLDAQLAKHLKGSEDGE